MKRICFYLMVMATFIFGGGKVVAQSVTIDGVVYSISGDHAYVSGINGVSDSVVVLGAVTFNESEYPVTQINTRVFYDCSYLKSVVVQSGVETIGGYAFSGCDSLVSVVLPEGLATIKEAAFYLCSALESVNVPESVISIEHSAFKGCSSLESITLPKELTTISEHTFENCTSLTSVILPYKLTAIKYDAFRGCTSLTTIDVPKGLTSVGTNVFTGTQIQFPVENGVRYIGTIAYQLANSTLGEYVIKEGTTAIHNSLFQNNSYVRSISIPNSVVSIGDYAFDNCQKLTDVNIPDSVVSIGNYMFRSCRNLTEINLPDGVVSIGNDAFRSCSSLTDINIPDSVFSIGNYAFSGCSSLQIVNIPSSVEAIGDYAFNNCSSLGLVYYNAANCADVASYTFDGCSLLKTVVIGDDVISIPSNLFYDDNIQDITIGCNVKEIGAWAFYSCNNLTSINIPSNVEYIGENAFKDCTALDSVYYNSINCPSIPSSSFNNNSIKTVVIGDDVKIIPTHLCCGNGNLNSVIIGENVVRISDNAFYNCTSLATINIPNSCDTIGNNAFYGCSSLPVEDTIRYADCYAIEVLDKTLTSYTLKENTRFMSPALFSGCSNMTAVNIPSGITAIGNNTFYNCSSLTSLTLPDGVTSIGEYAFYGCSALASVNIPSGVTAIGNRTFYNCSALTSLTLPDGVTSIGEYAFYRCSALASVNIPSGVTTIGAYTFYQCPSLTSITIPSSVTSIGNHAFNGCNGIKELTIADGNELLYLGSNETNYGGQFTSCKLEKLYLGRNVTSNYGHSPFCRITTLKEVIVGDSVTDIMRHLFDGCSALVSINIPSKVTEIGELTFNNCSSLTSMTLPEGLISIGREAFRNCDALTSIKIPSGVTSIGEYAFYDCNGIRDFELPATIDTIGSNNFYNVNMTIISQAATPPGIAGGMSGKLIYVPTGSGDAYRALYPDAIIVDGDGVTVTVDVSEPGLLGEEALKQVDYLYNVNNLVVSGTLNNTDWECIKNSMTRLVSIDMSGLKLSKIPDYFFSGKNLISKVVLPDRLTEIGSYAFQSCPRLRTILLPDTLQVINSYAFQSSALDSIVIPESVVAVGSYAFKNCSYLKSVNIPTGVKRLESQVFYGCSALQDVELSDSLTYIGSEAFRSCTSLTSMHLPDAVTLIDQYAFYDCTSLQSVTLPEQLAQIAREAFRNCVSLEDMEFPASLTTLGYRAFHDCVRLQSVTLPNVMSIGEYVFNGCNNLQSVSLPNVSSIGGYAFYFCNNLKEVTLSPTIRSMGDYIFSGCSQLASVTCQTLLPPAVSYIAPNDVCVLYAPEWTLEKYKLANGWSGFKTIEPISGIYPSDISIYKEETLTIPEDGLPEGYKPSLLMTDNAKLTVRGEIPMTLAYYEMSKSHALVNKANLTADSVVTKLSLSTNTWNYLTFPYDVKVSDIISAGGDWIICYYDGEARAQADFGNTWKTVPYDSILHAGEGYIWHCTNGNFTVPAMRNDNRNLIFAKDTRHTQLSEHAASVVANYGWNLIGNPYPCYFDTRFMEFSSPVTVRSGNSYAAYSPVDDSYILSPFEAFFVQCSADNNVVSFSIEGRQTNNTVRSLTSAPSVTRSTAAERTVLNLYLENNAHVDHTRLVVNEAASMDYEIVCDAAKFMSEDTSLPQLFTFVGNERMAINERPLADGKAALGVYIGVAGSYNLSLDTKSTDTEVYLIDKLHGTETNLTTDTYTFIAEAGIYTDRFEISMKRIGETGITEAAPAAAVKVVAVPGAINVMNATAPIYIYNAAGALVATKNGDAVTFEVEPGVYVVKVDSEVYKVSVVK